MARASATTGTTPPIFVPHDGRDPQPIRLNQDYFRIQIVGAQARFAGSFAKRSKRLLVASNVTLDHPAAPDPLKGLQRSRDVACDRAEQLGLAPNLVDLVPASMRRVRIDLEMIVDEESRLEPLANLINSDAFLSVVGLAPGTLAAAKTISRVSQAVLGAYLPGDMSRPILQFTADLNLGEKGLREGYYVILGTRDRKPGLPRPLPNLTVQGHELLADGKPVEEFCYLILEVVRHTARTRALHAGAEWDAKLREAVRKAEDAAADALATDRESVMRQVRGLVREARALLYADANYLEWEARAIIAQTLEQCRRILKIPAGEKRAGMGNTFVTPHLPIITWPSNQPIRLRNHLDTIADDFGFSSRAEVTKLSQDYARTTRIAVKELKLGGYDVHL